MADNKVSLSSRLSAQQGADVLSVEQKSAVWNRVSSHIEGTEYITSHSSFSSRVVWKWISSGALVVAMFGLLYGLWGGKYDSIIVDNKVFTLLRPQEEVIPTRALASSVGQIVTTDGSFSITNNGVSYRTNMLYDDDIISLPSNSRISFDVGGHQGYIAGPAELRIMKESDGYVFEMLEGEYLEVFSSRNETGTKLIVQMHDIVLAHNASDSTMKVQLSSDKQGETVIKNYADPVMISRMDDDQDTKELGAEKQLTVVPTEKVHGAVESHFQLKDIVYFAEVDVPVSVQNTALAVIPTKVSPIVVSDELGTGALAVNSVESMMFVDSKDDISDISDISSHGDTDDIVLLLPSEDQLNLLSQIASGRIDLWSSFVVSFGCSDDEVFSPSRARLCVNSLKQRYHIPPSLMRVLSTWVNSMELIDEEPDASQADLLEDEILGIEGSDDVAEEDKDIVIDIDTDIVIDIDTDTDLPVIVDTQSP